VIEKLLTFAAHFIVVTSDCLVEINFQKKYSKFIFKKHSLNARYLGNTTMKHRKIMCRFEIDIEPGTKKRVVEFSSTLEQSGLRFSRTD